MLKALFSRACRTTIAAALVGSAMMATPAISQEQYPEAQRYAREKCYSNYWWLKGYASYRDCYDDYYWRYVGGETEEPPL